MDHLFHQNLAKTLNPAISGAAGQLHLGLGYKHSLLPDSLSAATSAIHANSSSWLNKGIVQTPISMYARSATADLGLNHIGLTSATKVLTHDSLAWAHKAAINNAGVLQVKSVHETWMNRTNLTAIGAGTFDKVYMTADGQPLTVTNTHKPWDMASKYCTAPAHELSTQILRTTGAITAKDQLLQTPIAATGMLDKFGLITDSKYALGITDSILLSKFEIVNSVTSSALKASKILNRLPDNYNNYVHDVSGAYPYTNTAHIPAYHTLGINKNLLGIAAHGLCNIIDFNTGYSQANLFEPITTVKRIHELSYTIGSKSALDLTATLGVSKFTAMTGLREATTATSHFTAAAFNTGHVWRSPNLEVDRYGIINYGNRSYDLPIELPKATPSCKNPTTTTRVQVNYILIKKLALISSSVEENYRGAIHVLNDRGPDFARHMSVSLRQMFDWVVMKLPNKQQLIDYFEREQAKFADKKYGGNPADRERNNSRLAYLFLTEKKPGMLTDDEFMTLYYETNSGVHTFSTNHSYETALDIFERSEAILLYILEAREATNN